MLCCRACRAAGVLPHHSGGSSATTSRSTISKEATACYCCCYWCRVVVGGGRPADALQLLAVQPVLWAALLGLTVNFLQLPLPGSVAAVAAALGPANKPLMLLSAGMLLQPQPPQVRQVGGGDDAAALGLLGRQDIPGRWTDITLLFEGVGILNLFGAFQGLGTSTLVSQQ